MKPEKSPVGDRALESLYLCYYAALFACCDLTRAHLALVAAMILLRPSADNLRFLEVTAPVAAGCSGFRNFAHLALWA